MAGWSCGDDDPPPHQAVIWMGFSTGTQGTCSSTRTYTVPDTAIQTITSQNASGERVTDGGADIVDCSISPTATAGVFDVSLYYSNLANEIGNLQITGALSQGASGNATISMQTSTFFLQNASSQPCVATVKTLDERGAIWISNFSCPSMVDPSSPNTNCVGSGGFIFENCD